MWLSHGWVGPEPSPSKAAMLTILTKSGHWIASLSPMTTYLYVEDPVTCDLKRSQQSSAIALLAYEKAKTDEGEKRTPLRGQILKCNATGADLSKAKWAYSWWSGDFLPKYEAIKHVPPRLKHYLESEWFLPLRAGVWIWAARKLWS